MNINQLFKMTVLAAVMAGCVAEENTNNAVTQPNDAAKVTTPVNQEEAAQQKKDSVEHQAQMKSVIQKMEFGYKYGSWVSGPNSYKVKGEPQFAVVDFDSAGIKARVLLDRDAAYDFLMQRQAKNKQGQPKQYVLKDAALKELKCGDDIKPYAELDISYVGKGQKPAVRDNSNRTNETELKIYRQYGAIISPESFQCYMDRSSDNWDLFPSYAVIKNGGVENNAPLDRALDIVADYKKGQDIVIKRITHEKRELSADGMTTDTHAYVIEMGKPAPKAQQVAVKTTPKP